MSPTRIVAIDGQNAIHALGLAGVDREAAYRALLARVRGRAGAATVFFDGHPPAGFGGTRDAGLTVRYSRDREADDELIDALRAAARPRDVLVVTDDLDLAHRATQLGARTCRVGSFFRDEAAPAPEKPSGPGGFTPADFGLPDEIDLGETDAPAGRIGRGGAAPGGKKPGFPGRPRIRGRLGPRSWG